MKTHDIDWYENEKDFLQDLLHTVIILDERSAALEEEVGGCARVWPPLALQAGVAHSRCGGSAHCMQAVETVKEAVRGGRGIARSVPETVCPNRRRWGCVVKEC